MKFKKFLPLFLISLTLVGCNKKEQQPMISELRGTFESSLSIKNYVSKTTGVQRIYDDNDPMFVGSATLDLNADNRNLQLVTLWPFREGLTDGQLVRFNVTQKLKLNKDFTYNYSYSIFIGGLYFDDESDKNISSVDVVMNGKYSYREFEENNFTVTLENPTSGKEEIYGCFSETTDESFRFWKWKKNVFPSYVVDFKDAKSNPIFTFDKYTTKRLLKVHKGKPDVDPLDVNYVDADYYDPYFMDFVSQYAIF